MHDAFEWWSTIVIPALVGAATVLVSVAALVSSGRATKLGRKVEAQRAAAEIERQVTEDRRRLQDMAIQDARVLHRWAAEGYRRSGWFVTTPVGQPLQRTPFQQAEIDAIVALQQSLVPGAEVLLELTQLDMTHRGTGEPMGSAGVVSEEAVEDWDKVRRAREERTYTRIREWALDPASITPIMLIQHAKANSNLNEYLRAGVRETQVENKRDDTEADIA